MSMEDIMKALMQSAAASQQQPQQQQQSGGGGDAMSQMLGGLLGGGQQQSGAGGDILSQVVGGLLGGGQQSSGGGGVGQLLGGLQQILGGTPGTGQQLPLGGNSAAATSSPVMALLQPVVNQLARKVGISPEIATMIVSIALHYLVQSSPTTPGASPLDLGNVMQTLSSGGKISPSTLQSSGMVNDVMQATGLNEQQAVKSLNTTFSVLAAPVKGKGGSKRGRDN